MKLRKAQHWTAPSAAPNSKSSIRTRSSWMLFRMTKKRKKNPGKGLRRAALRPVTCAALAAALLSGFAAGAPAAKRKPVSKVVTGQVLDKEDNGIAGAVVQLTDLQTKRQMSVTTQDDGHYQFSDLSPTHDYQLQAIYKGASSEVKRVTSFDSRTRIVLNLTIPPAQASPPPK